MENPKFKPVQLRERSYELLKKIVAKIQGKMTLGKIPVCDVADAALRLLAKQEGV